jgi:hypothetical protein
MSETRKFRRSSFPTWSAAAGSRERIRIARYGAFEGLRSDLIDPVIAVHHGRIVKRTAAREAATAATSNMVI